MPNNDDDDDVASLEEIKQINLVQNSSQIIIFHNKSLQ